MNRILQILFYSIVFMIISITFTYAGPPYNTDDPEPVGLHHWEFYLSSAVSFSSNHSEGTLPHFEINFGAFKNTQIHLIIPFNFDYEEINNFKYSYSNTEIGVKYRLLEESENFPQIGTFPILELPSSSNSKQIQVFLPIWIQKSFDKWSMYGGGGYWINPGEGNLDFVFLGSQVQYEFNDFISQGLEIFYHSKQMDNESSQFFLNYGGIINFNQNCHLLYSIGHSVSGEQNTICYLGFQFTI